MSQFDRYTVTEYVEALRSFLDISKRNFLREYGFVEDADAQRKGRLPKYPEEPIKALEKAANEKAARAEALDTTVGERYRIARDYLGLTDAQVARDMGVSRELVRRWGADIHRPNVMTQLAELLNVPQAWLEDGGEENLPANSHIGVRVAEEALQWREQLFGLTQAVVADLPDTADESYAQAYIEWAVANKFEMARAARRAGGRWQIVSNTLLFSPWVPIPEHGLSKRFWSDDVEAIIQEELAAKPSVYGAWEAMRARCEAMGLGPDAYPKRISLFKRAEKERARAEKFGVDLNDVVAAAVEKFSKQ
jgi:transcriptional regulator with XRE-family HTH domain